MLFVVIDVLVCLDIMVISVCLGCHCKGMAVRSALRYTVSLSLAIIIMSENKLCPCLIHFLLLLKAKRLIVTI